MKKYNYSESRFPQIEDFVPESTTNDEVTNKEGNTITILIKSEYENMYITLGDNDFLYANEESPRRGQIFKMTLVEENKVTLRIHGTRYIRVNRYNLLVADVLEDEATIFTVYQHDEDSYVLLAPNNRYVRVRPADNRLTADAVNDTPRTEFKFRNVEY